MLFLDVTGKGGALFRRKQAEASLYINQASALGFYGGTSMRVLGGSLLPVVNFLYQTTLHILQLNISQTTGSYASQLGGHLSTSFFQGSAYWLSPNYGQGVYSMWEGLFRQCAFTPGHILSSHRGHSHRRRKSAVSYASPAFSPLGRFWSRPLRLQEVYTVNQGSVSLSACLATTAGHTAAQSLDTGFFFPDSGFRHDRVLNHRRLRHAQRWRRRLSLKYASTGRLVRSEGVLNSSRHWGSVLSPLRRTAGQFFMAVGGALNQANLRYYRGIRLRQLQHNQLPIRSHRVFFLEPALKHAYRPILYKPSARYSNSRAHLGLRGLRAHWQHSHWQAAFNARRGLQPLASWITQAELSSTPALEAGFLGKYTDINKHSAANTGIHKAKPTMPINNPLTRRGLVNRNLSHACVINKAAPYLKSTATPPHRQRPQVRYKPGFMTYWRVHRRAFCKAFWMPFGHRQKRLTSYIARLRRIATFSYFRLQQLTLTKLVLHSHLIPQLSALQAWCLSVSGVFSINGIQAKNPLCQVYTADVIQYTQFSHLPSVATPMSKLWYCLYGISKKRTPTINIDTPSYLEVDELCLAVLVLFEPRLSVAGVRGQIGAPVPFLTLKCYNWKYVV